MTIIRWVELCILEHKDEIILVDTRTWCLERFRKWIHSTRERFTCRYYWKKTFCMHAIGSLSRFKIFQGYVVYLCKINPGQAQKCVRRKFQSQRTQYANLSKTIWTLENEWRLRHCILFSSSRWNCEHHEGCRRKDWKFSDSPEDSQIPSNEVWL